jgi:heptosyltransferase-2
MGKSTMALKADVREALVIRLSSFGDIVLTEPVVRMLTTSFPGCRVRFMTNIEHAGLPALFDGVEEVIGYRRRGFNTEIRELGRRVRFDLTVDLQNSLRSRRILWFIRGGRVLRFRRARLRRFLLVHAPRLWRRGLPPTATLYARTLEPVVPGPPEAIPRIRPGAEALARAEALGPSPDVALCPGGSSPYKCWPARHFAGLADMLAGSGRSVVVVGSEADRRAVEEVRAAGTSSLPHYVGDEIALTAAVLSRAAVTVSNDSGLMHLAAATGSRVAAIFGPTSPLLGFAPSGAGHVAAGLAMDCSPCSYHGNRPCRLGHRACLEDLRPEAVMEIVEGMLEDIRAR